MAEGDAGTVGIFVEDSTGDVGIGTTSPTKRLEVAGGIKQSGGTVSFPISLDILSFFGKISVNPLKFCQYSLTDCLNA